MIFRLGIKFEFLLGLRVARNLKSGGSVPKSV